MIQIWNVSDVVLNGNTPPGVLAGAGLASREVPCRHAKRVLMHVDAQRYAPIGAGEKYLFELQMRFAPNGPFHTVDQFEADPTADVEQVVETTKVGLAARIFLTATGAAETGLQGSAEIVTIA